MSAHTHLSHQSKGSVEAPGVGVLSDFVVEPAKLGQSAAGVPQGLAQHHLVGAQHMLKRMHPLFVYSSYNKQELYDVQQHIVEMRDNDFPANTESNLAF